MKASFSFLVLLFFAGSVESQVVATSKKILVVYFSHSGNTRTIANQIHKKLGGDIFELIPAKAYPKDYNVVVEQAKQELRSKFKPALKTNLGNIKPYDIVFIGYPNWWETIPGPVRTFLSETDLSGKTIVPFCTHGGSALGSSIDDIRRLAPKSTLWEGLAIRDSYIDSSEGKLNDWLKKLKLLK